VIIVGGGGGGALLFLLMMVIGFIFLIGIPLSRAGAVRRHHAPVPWQPRQPYGWEAPQQPVLPAVTAADVSSLRDRLGHDVRSLEPGPDPVARQAMADASERYSTASTLLERASSDAQLRTAWLAAVEGLAATQTVRQRLGLDLGPPVPSLPSAGPAPTRPARRGPARSARTARRTSRRARADRRTARPGTSAGDRARRSVSPGGSDRRCRSGPGG